MSSDCAHKPFLVCEKLLLRFFPALIPMLEKGVTHRDVRIDGRLLEGLIIPDLERCVVHCFVRIDSRAFSEGQIGTAYIGQGIHKPVSCKTNPVTEGRRSENRQYEIETMAYAVMAQRLAEISLLFLDAEGIPCNIGCAGNSGDGIKEKPDEFITCRLESELQQIVQHSGGCPEIVVYVAEDNSEIFRNDVGIYLCYGFKHPEIKPVVKVVHHLVHRS